MKTTLAKARLAVSLGGSAPSGSPWQAGLGSAALLLVLLVTVPFAVARVRRRRGCRQRREPSQGLGCGLGSRGPAPQVKKTAPPKLAKKPKVSKTPRATATRTTAPQASRSSRQPTATPKPAYVSPKEYVRSILSAAQFACADAVFTAESRWNPYATNPASGAYGIAQALPPSKYASAGADWRTNGVTQVRWGLSYMDSRYGSPCGAWDFWQSNHWY
ncbi:transglycosylase SLT domain-containing protein [Streptomyces sp. NPDC006265]|uniref:aggregation-promoting factor C-terminal-like domain-containing protein n=1 Tax=Streptomyces sp. NPDC006265 TaxID=3156740 RepID=UPI0033ADD097